MKFKFSPRTALGLVALVAALWVFFNVQFIKPFEPNKFETIETNELGFLVPLTGDSTKQAVTQNEKYWQERLVQAKQVRIPQRWVKSGYEFWTYNGKYIDDARLIKVNLAPVTREWTAEKDRGTAAVDQAIWVQTSDPVELSTGWTIEASIAGQEDAVKFLHYFRNDTLAHVLDNNVRSKLQSTFGLEVTDIPLDKLRSAATPHIKATVKEVVEFFKERGITISNLGITGGFVFKNKDIEKKMASVYQAEQEKAISIAGTQAQIETNKKIQLEAEAKAKAILTEKEAEAKGIQAVTVARKGEMEAAGQNIEAYTRLKLVEVMRSFSERWDGKLPNNIYGAAPGLSLLLPTPKETK